MRMRMKSASSASSGASFENLSGKEKAKYLKTLKQKKAMSMNKEEPCVQKVSSEAFTIEKNNKPVKKVSGSLLTSTSVPTPAPVPVPASTSFSIPLPSKSSDSITSKKESNVSLLSNYDNSDGSDGDEMVEKDVQQTATVASSSSLPAGFFDDPNEQQTATQPIVVPVETQQASSNSAQVTQSHPDIEKTSAETTTGALPEGFFDSTEDDMKARGVDVKAVAKKIEVEADQTLTSFFDEVDHLPVAPEEDEEDAGEDEELASQAVQLAYETKLAFLLQEAEQKSRKRARNETEFNASEATKEAEAVLQEYTSSAQKEEAGLSDISAEVEAALKKKKQKKKMSVSNGYVQDYIPMDFADCWTSKRL